MIGADLNGHEGEGNRGVEVALGRYDVKERNAEGQMVVGFVKRIKRASRKGGIWGNA